MRKFALLAFVSALAPQVVTADVVRHSSVPQTYRGTWAPSAGSCENTDKSAIVLSAKAYKGPEGSCGELVACNDAGVPDFYRLHFHRHDHGLCVWAFDLLDIESRGGYRG